MWKISEFVDQLTNMDQCSLIDEILLINNDINSTPISFNIANYSKIIEIKPPSNMFVNPSWNLGVRMAKCNKVLIGSDDTFFHNWEEVLTKVAEELDKEDCIIGLDLNHDVITKSDLKINTTNESSCIDFIEIDKRGWGWGCAIFANKNSYVPINKQLLIWYGDDYISETYKRRGLKIKKMTGAKITGYVSKTVNHINHLIELKHKDENLWNSNKELLFSI